MRIIVEPTLEHYELPLKQLVDAFMSKGGTLQLEQRKVIGTGISDEQWLKAQLMAIIDDSTITFED